MKRFLSILALGMMFSCGDSTNKDTGGTTEKIGKQENSMESPDIASIEADLKKKGYQTFSYKAGDTTYSTGCSLRE